MGGIEQLRMGLDPVLFAERAGLSDPDPWQEQLLRSTSLRILLNCSRQSGKSTISALLSLHRALYHPNSLVLILAPTLRQSQELYGKIQGFYRELGKPVAAKTEQRLGLELVNKSRIVVLPGTEKTIRGYSGVDLLIVDEASRVEDGLYYGVRPMLAVSGGRLMMLSTPFGKRGVFYEEWTESIGWERYEVPATEIPRISPAFLEEERKALGPWWFEHEYMCEFRETDDQIFPNDVIEQAITDEVEPLFGGEL